MRFALSMSALVALVISCCPRLAVALSRGAYCAGAKVVSMLASWHCSRSGAQGGRSRSVEAGN